MLFRSGPEYGQALFLVAMPNTWIPDCAKRTKQLFVAGYCIFRPFVNQDAGMSFLMKNQRGRTRQNSCAALLDFPRS